MSDVFYIKWRPKFFSEVIGQENVINTIKNSFIMSKMHHSYLISGPHGIGKTTIARLIAKGLNCKNKKNFNIDYNFPCGKCDNCKLIENSNFLDIIEIDAASKTKVEDIRDLLSGLQYLPCSGFNKVYLIDEVHMLSKQSFGTLLKSLEEPPSNTTFILATTDIKKIPKTILSRCLCFNLNNIKTEFIINRLISISKIEKINFELEAIHLIAESCKGSMRDALNLLEQSMIIGNNKINLNIINNLIGFCDLEILVDIIIYIYKSDYNNLFIKINNISSSTLDYEFILNKILIILHYIFILKFNENYILDVNLLKIKFKILNLSKEISLKKINILSIFFLNFKKNLSYYPNHKMGFEISILQIFCILNKKN